jgi:hypothetical protein
MLVQAELDLAEADERIAEADHNIRRIASLLPGLAGDGDVSFEVQRRLELMVVALTHLRAQRRTIVATLDGEQPLPRIMRRPH